MVRIRRCDVRGFLHWFSLHYFHILHPTQSRSFASKVQLRVHAMHGKELGTWNCFYKQSANSRWLLRPRRNACLEVRHIAVQASGLGYFRARTLRSFKFKSFLLLKGCGMLCFCRNRFPPIQNVRPNVNPLSQILVSGGCSDRICKA